LNDITAHEGKLYVSYFSYSGNWKNGIFDGGVSEISIRKDNCEYHQLINGLWKPHSPLFIDGCFYILDSMRGTLKKGNYNLAKFNGFVRGIASYDDYIFIGQSEDMYISVRFGGEDAIIMNAGFYVFDTKSHAARFFPMLNTMNVHSIISI